MNLIFTPSPDAALRPLLDGRKAMIVTDSNVAPLLPAVLPCAASLPQVVIPAGEQHKSADYIARIWDAMIACGLNRNSLVVNAGGGVITDMGGFAAATFKRGIDFVNVPTTLLGAVDASVGGKTGFDYHGLKNEIGVFADASATLISTAFFGTLPRRELLSGYAEMLKHALLDSPEATAEALQTEPEAVTEYMLERSVRVKERIVLQDPREKGLRKALNLGHTAGHAIESLMLGRDRGVPHGYAVAWGLTVALVLSNIKSGLDSATLYATAEYVREHYGTSGVTCDDYPELLDMMHHDKKNTGDIVTFTLLEAPGKPLINCTITDDEITTALDIARDLLGG